MVNGGIISALFSDDQLFVVEKKKKRRLKPINIRLPDEIMQHVATFFEFKEIRRKFILNKKFGEFIKSQYNLVTVLDMVITEDVCIMHNTELIHKHTKHKITYRFNKIRLFKKVVECNFIIKFSGRFTPASQYNFYHQLLEELSFNKSLNKITLTFIGFDKPRVIIENTFVYNPNVTELIFTNCKYGIRLFSYYPNLKKVTNNNSNVVYQRYPIIKYDSCIISNSTQVITNIKQN